MKHRSRHAQRGLTMLMVMILMTAMLMGALSFARITEVGTLVTNNIVNKDSSYHAAEVGRATAFAQLQALANKNNDSGTWYFAMTQPTTPATGIPAAINYTNAGVVVGGVGRFTVNYSVERLCLVNNVTDSSSQCLVLQTPSDQTDLVDKGFQQKDYLPMNPRQYRITVRVTDPRGMQTWTQTLVTAAN